MPLLDHWVFLALSLSSQRKLNTLTLGEVVIVSLILKTSEYASLSLLRYANVRNLCLSSDFRLLKVKKSRQMTQKVTIYISNYLFNLQAELRSV